jgi:hypothetical protein
MGVQVSVQNTAVRFSGYPRAHDSISAYQWRGIEDGKVGSNDKASMVAWIDAGGTAWVSDGVRWIQVLVVRPSYGQPYLRTYADGLPSDNLLSLPSF